MVYVLTRKRDGAGDSGTMSMGLSFNKDDGSLNVEYNARPRVGIALRVGSAIARSYQEQDWWQTTTISEILEEEDHRVIFKTVNGSIYTWIMD